ncbi:MAG: efflux RND transporter permease subunit, partial [Clostridia bacterium]|nr:efflux RND transporter permease subunit [Clostridia bacterium]
MLSRISVKKPYTVIVGIILVIVLGVIAFGRMTTDMLPSMNFPYVIVYTTYIGATPEQIETEVTRPMESSFATLTDIKEIQSRSRDNLALVILEFNSDADMNTALIEIDSEITTLQASWPDAVGAPAILKINPDLLPVSIVSVSREDMDILALSTYVNDTLIPRYESINGVAQVSASGLIQQEVDVTIEQDRIDVLNNAILRDVDAQLADVEEQLDNAQAQLSDGRSQLARQKSAILGQLNSALEQLDGGAEQMESALSELKAQRAQLAEQLEQVNSAIGQLESLPTLTENQKALLKQLQEQLGALEGQKEQLESRLEAIRDQQGTDRISGQREDA